MNKRAVNIYLLIFALCSVGILLPIAAFNYFMDPFEYFNVPSFFWGLNEKKLPGSTQERFDKAMKIISKKPKAIMLGSSRVRAGFPTSYYSKLAGYPALKVAFSGARFNEIFAYFEHALYNQPDLKAVFIGLDFFSFSKNLSPITDYSKESLKKSSATINDLFKLLFSKDTLKFSYATYEHNRNPKKFEIVDRIHVKVDDNDYVDLGLPMIESPQDFLRAEKRLVFDNYEIDPEKIEMFKKIAVTCKDRSIDLKVIFCPAHATYWDMVCQCDCWHHFENLKKELSAIYPIFDFSGFNKFNEEPLSKEFSGMYFFEMSHFTPEYGKMILDKVYGIEDRCPETGLLLPKR